MEKAAVKGVEKAYGHVFDKYDKTCYKTKKEQLHNEENLWVSDIA